MPLRPLYGHEGTRNRLAGAVASGRLPQAILLEGPKGVGKQRLALWLGQLLLCTDPTKSGPCGSCSNCRMALSLQHPDLHWFVPVEPSKKGADADKQVDLVEEALGEIMAERREQPLYEAPSGLARHGVASVRLLLRRLHLTPAMAQRKTFIVGDAERLIPQQGTEAAANAILKALEEPPADSTFVLTAAEPEALLPTILSRVVRVRLARLPDTVVASFAQQELDLDEKGQNQRPTVASADGCIGKLLALYRSRGIEHGEDAALAALRGERTGRLAFALRQQTYQARGGFTAMLDGLLVRLRSEARTRDDWKGAHQLVAAIARVLEFRDLAQRNVNPQLLAAVLSDDLAETA